MVAEGVAGEDVGKVDFDHRLAGGADGIVKGDRGVAVSPWINDDSALRAGRFLDPVDEHAFLVALAEIDREAELLAAASQSRSIATRLSPP